MAKKLSTGQIISTLVNVLAALEMSVEALTVRHLVPLQPLLDSQVRSKKMNDGWDGFRDSVVRLIAALEAYVADPDQWQDAFSEFNEVQGQTFSNLQTIVAIAFGDDEPGNEKRAVLDPRFIIDPRLKDAEADLKLCGERLQSMERALQDVQTLPGLGVRS